MNQETHKKIIRNNILWSEIKAKEQEYNRIQNKISELEILKADVSFEIQKRLDESKRISDSMFGVEKSTESEEVWISIYPSINDRRISHLWYDAFKGSYFKVKKATTDDLSNIYGFESEHPNRIWIVSEGKHKGNIIYKMHCKVTPAKEFEIKLKMNIITEE